MQMFKDFTFRDIIYIAAILGSAAVMAYRVSALESAMADVKSKYVTTEVNNLQHQALQLSIDMAKVDRDRQMLDLELRILKRGMQ